MNLRLKLFFAINIFFHVAAIFHEQPIKINDYFVCVNQLDAWHYRNFIVNHSRVMNKQLYKSAYDQENYKFKLENHLKNLKSRIKKFELNYFIFFKLINNTYVYKASCVFKTKGNQLWFKDFLFDTNEANEIFAALVQTIKEYYKDVEKFYIPGFKVKHEVILDYHKILLNLGFKRNRNFEALRLIPKALKNGRIGFEFTVDHKSEEIKNSEIQEDLEQLYSDGDDEMF